MKMIGAKWSMSLRFWNSNMRLINNPIFQLATELSNVKSSRKGRVGEILLKYNEKIKIEHCKDIIRQYSNNQKMFIPLQNLCLSWADRKLEDGGNLANSREFYKAKEFLEDAKECFELISSLPIVSSVELKVKVAICEANIGAVYTDLGDYPKAFSALESAKQIFEKMDMERESAFCDGNMARLHRLSHQYDNAFDIYKSLINRFRKEKKEADNAKAKLGMAEIYQDLRNHKKAIAFNKSARIIFERLGKIVDVAGCDLGMANLYYDQEQYDLALLLYNSARDIYEKKGVRIEVARCDEMMGIVHKCLGNYDLALGRLQSAKEIFRKKNMKSEIAGCETNIAGVHSARGEHDLAIEMYKRLNRYYYHLFRIKLLSRVGMAKSYKALGQLGKARNSVDRAVEMVETNWSALSQETIKTQFLGSVYGVYEDAVGICLQQSNFGNALEYVERSKSKNLAELLGDRDLIPKNAIKKERQEYQELRSLMRNYGSQLLMEQNKAQIAKLKENLRKLGKQHEELTRKFKENDPTFDPNLMEKISCSDIKALLSDGGSAIVELFPMEDKTVIFVILNDIDINESAVIIRNYNISDLKNDISRLTEKYLAYQKGKKVQKEQARQTWEKCLDQILLELYKKLFLKIKPYLEGVKKIVIIPYHGFHLLPLHAMFSENDGHRRYLIDDYEMTYAPSSKILKTCLERERNKREKAVIALANPRQNNDVLRFAWDEVEAIRMMFDDSQVLPKSTKTDIINCGREAHVFHYAGHAHHKGLILHDEADRGISAEYSLRDIFINLDLPRAWLATLSACETGITPVREVDEYVGLTSGLLHAGAATVISSLWSVSDISTYFLMKKMYGLIKKGRGKAEALRGAQLWLKNPENKQEHLQMLPEWCKDKEDGQRAGFPDRERFATESIVPEKVLPSDLSRPYYWAGFICSGAP